MGRTSRWKSSFSLVTVDLLFLVALVLVLGAIAALMSKDVMAAIAWATILGVCLSGIRFALLGPQWDEHEDAQACVDLLLIGAALLATGMTGAWVALIILLVGIALYTLGAWLWNHAGQKVAPVGRALAGAVSYSGAMSLMLVWSNAPHAGPVFWGGLCAVAAYAPLAYRRVMLMLR